MSDSFYLVAGLGKTGVAIARYLRRKNKPFVVFDTRKELPDLAAFSEEFPQVAVYLEQVPTEIISQLTDIIASPGLPLDTPFLEQARQLGVAIYGDIECLAREIKAPVVAITGTNGKSTVTTLVGEMAKAAGLRVAVAGNIGIPVLDLLDQEVDLWVLELSSFQLDLTYSLSPLVATILNVTPDHLDRHHTLEAYVQAKQGVYSKAKTVLWNREEEYTYPQFTEQLSIPCLSFGRDKPAAGSFGLVKKEKRLYLAKGNQLLLPVESLLIKGVHNWLNALAAAALAEAAGIPTESILFVLKTFGGLPHRCQWIRELDQVVWINDSKGTNVGATLSAVHGIGESASGKIVLIAGGQGKGADFKTLAKALAAFVRTMILIGEDASKMEAVLAQVVPIRRASSLEEAVVMAKTVAKPGDVVLLSPACASLDMFKDFNHRGEVFASSVLGLPV